MVVVVMVMVVLIMWANETVSVLYINFGCC